MTIGTLKRSPLQRQPDFPPREVLCGQDFLIPIVRRSGSTETDAEILYRFRHCQTTGGYYRLKGKS